MFGRRPWPVAALLFLGALLAAARAQGGEAFTGWTYPTGFSCPQVRRRLGDRLGQRVL